MNNNQEMKQFRVIFLLLLFISVGCKKELNINFGEPSKKIVLYPVVTNNKKITIKMSGPTSILSTSFPILENARVVISDNDVPVDTVIINSKGNGYSKIFPLFDHKYIFRASATGYPEAICETQLPKPVESLFVDTSHINFQVYKNLRARLRIKDDPNVINYYKATIYIKTFHTHETYYSPNRIIKDTSYTQISQLMSYANIPDIGFFYYPAQAKFFLARDKNAFADGSDFKYEFGSEIYFQGSEFYFSDDLFNGKEIILNIITGSSITTNQTEKYIIELSTMSETYYMGLKSYASYGTKEMENLPMSEEVSIYSAVTGGYGFPIASTTVCDSSFWRLKY
jgi:hypothetical protein